MRYCFFVFLGSLGLNAQDFKTTDFESPLKIDILPSGTFGELRSNHFHAGLDIRTQQKTGFPIYAPYDGFVSRIKVSSYGYGKALYIDHPDGTTTVYGHLESYNGKIGEYVRKVHYDEKNFEIEMFPKKNELTVMKGDIIGFTGNSGGSGGPHLHYEFRDTRTQKIVNPLTRGMDVFIKDSKAPLVNSITAYAIDNNAVVNQSHVPIQLTFKKNGNVLVADPVKAKGLVGFGVNSFDESDQNYAKNGLYNVQASLNGELVYSYVFDTFSFNESRYVNALIDYETYIKTNQRIQKLFSQKPYPLSVLRTFKDNGVINVKPGESYVYKVVLSDYHKNETILHIPIEYSPSESKVPSTNESNKVFINSDKEYIFEQSQFMIEFPANVFYNDFYLNLFVEEEALHLHENTVPIHKNIVITLETKDMKNINYDKAFIGKIDTNKVEYYTTRKKGTKLSIRTRNFGVYKLMEDVEAPIIDKPSFSEGDWLSNAERIEFQVKDALTGIESISGFINDQWVLFDYDYKTNKIVHLFSDGIVSSGRNEVTIIVKDKVGNESKFQTYFHIK